MAHECIHQQNIGFRLRDETGQIWQNRRLAHNEHVCSFPQSPSESLAQKTMASEKKNSDTRPHPTSPCLVSAPLVPTSLRRSTQKSDRVSFRQEFKMTRIAP